MHRPPSLSRRLTLVGAVAAMVGTMLVPAALAAPPADVLERAREGMALGQGAAQDLAAPGIDDEKLTGLARAEAAIAAAAERKAERTDKEFPGKGRALGRGHSDAVHAILAEGGSPSDLPPHGQTVSAFARAYETLRADHPGRGEGLTKDKTARDADGESGDADG